MHLCCIESLVGKLKSSNASHIYPSRPFGSFWKRLDLDPFGVSGVEVKYCQSLDFTERPDYSFLKRLFKERS